MLPESSLEELFAVLRDWAKRCPCLTAQVVVAGAVVRKVRRCGGCLCVTVPRRLLEEVGLSIGSEVEPQLAEGAVRYVKSGRGYRVSRAGGSARLLIPRWAAERLGIDAGGYVEIVACGEGCIELRPRSSSAGEEESGAAAGI